MAVVKPSSSIKDYLDIKKSSKKVFLDTNILVSYSHKRDLYYEDSLEAISILESNDFQFYCNTITRSEYMDFKRRLIITEELLSFADSINLKNDGDMHRILAKMKHSYEKKIDSGKLYVCSDRDIKGFRKKLSRPKGEVENLWMCFCENRLLTNLIHAWKLISSKLDINYLSTRKDGESPEINQPLTWDSAHRISGKTGISMNDAMILNIFQSSSIPFLITTDFDIIYAASVLPSDKYIFCPDSLCDEYYRQ